MIRPLRRALALGIVAGLGSLAAAAPSAARPLFTSRITVDGSQVQSIGVDRVRDLPELYDDSNLLVLFPAYTPNSSVSAELDLRGLPAQIRYAANSSSLELQIPGVLSVRFDGSTREQAAELLEDWLQGDFTSAAAPGGALGDLLGALVRYSPVDPVAGNPNSLLSRMFDADYRLGSEGPFLSGARLPDAPDLFSTGPELAYTESGPFHVRRAELPLSYRANLREPSVSLLLDLPLTLTSTEGQLSGLGSLGAGLQIRPLSWWSLTPLVRIGSVASEGLGALAVLYSGSLTSHVHVPLGGFELGIANLVGASHTYDDIQVGDLELDYNLANVTIRNGGSVSGPLGCELLGSPVGFEVFGSDQRFFGDDLFLEAQAEVGAALLLFGDLAGSRYRAAELGAAYVFGSEVDEVTLELRLRF